MNTPIGRKTPWNFTEAVERKRTSNYSKVAEPMAADTTSCLSFDEEQLRNVAREEIERERREKLRRLYVSGSLPLPWIVQHRLNEHAERAHRAEKLRRATAVELRRGAEILGSLNVGDEFRYRFEFWREGEWMRREVVAISSRGSRICVQPGRKAKHTYSLRVFGNLSADSRFQFEIVRRAPRGLGEGEPKGTQ